MFATNNEKNPLQMMKVSARDRSIYQAGRGEEPAERQLEVHARRNDQAIRVGSQITAEYPPQVPAITATTSQQSRKSAVINPTEVLSKKSTVLAEVPQQPAVTTFKVPEKSLSNTPPKVARYRLLGNAAEMAVSKSYGEYFSVEERLARAFWAGATGAMESRAQGLFASPSPHRPNSLSPHASQLRSS